FFYLPRLRPPPTSPLFPYTTLFRSTIYALGGECIAGMTPGSYLEAFFFSVQTLATVGYGHWYPQTLYGHVVTTVEIINGMFGLRSEEHTSELQSRGHLVCRLLLEKK